MSIINYFRDSKSLRILNNYIETTKKEKLNNMLKK